MSDSPMKLPWVSPVVVRLADADAAEGGFFVAPPEGGSFRS